MEDAFEILIPLVRMFDVAAYANQHPLRTKNKTTGRIYYTLSDLHVNHCNVIATCLASPNLPVFAADVCEYTVSTDPATELETTLSLTNHSVLWVVMWGEGAVCEESWIIRAFTHEVVSFLGKSVGVPPHCTRLSTFFNTRLKLISPLTLKWKPMPVVLKMQ